MAQRNRSTTGRKKLEKLGQNVYLEDNDFNIKSFKNLLGKLMLLFHFFCMLKMILF